MAQFTPGPWEAHEGDDYVAVKPASPTSRITDIVERVCGWTRDEAEANARLIAAAPELYEMTALLERSVAYEIKKLAGDGDDEGARLKTVLLAQVRDLLGRIG